MEQWEQERNAVLTWWPTILAGRKPPGHMFVAGLEEAAWGCATAADWDAWLTQAHAIWPQVIDDLDDLALRGRRPWVQDRPEERSENGGLPSNEMPSSTDQINTNQINTNQINTDESNRRGARSADGAAEWRSYPDLLDERSNIAPERPDNSGIDSHLGPTLGQAVHAKIAHRAAPLQLPHPGLTGSRPHQEPAVRAAMGAKTTGRRGGIAAGRPTDQEAVARPMPVDPHPDVGRLAQQVQAEFALAEIAVAHTSSNAWVIKQLNDARMGLSQMAMALGIPSTHVGHGRLKLWFHEASTRRGASVGRRDHIEIHGRGGDVAQAWANWRMSALARAGVLDVAVRESDWRVSWNRSARAGLERVDLLLDKSQAALKAATDRVDAASDFGQRAFRRYLAVCKWLDLARGGADPTTVLNGWSKVKTGNRIAWTGAPVMGHETVVAAWMWEERFLDQALFAPERYETIMGAAPRPSWVRRYTAIAHDIGTNDTNVTEEDVVALWSLGVEAVLRQHIGFDSWTAGTNLCQPDGFELDEFRAFYTEHLAGPLLAG